MNTPNATVTASPQKQELVHKKACKNCFKLHRKCNKQMPCDYCSLRGKPCEINPCIKKRGRPLGSTNKNKPNKEDKNKPNDKKKPGKPVAKKAKLEDEEEKECHEHHDHSHHVAVRPFVDDDFSFDNSIVIQGVHTELPQEIQPIKICTACTASVIDTAKFCTNCGISMIDSSNVEMHSKLDNLRWKNTILEQKLHRFSTSEGNKDSKSSFPVAPYLASWDFSSFDKEMPLFNGSFIFNNQQSFSNIPPAANSADSHKQESSIFDIAEPAVFLDSSNIASDQMINWAFSFEQSFKKEGQDDSGLFANLQSTEFPLFNNSLPKF